MYLNTVHINKQLSLILTIKSNNQGVITMEQPTYKEKKEFLENKMGLGQVFYKIVEDPNDPTKWEERMPSNGYRFYLNHETNKVDVVFEEYFNCYDGWDSTLYECGTYESKEEAVEAVWLKEHNKMYTA